MTTHDDTNERQLLSAWATSGVLFAATMTVAVLSAIDNFFFIPYAPFWSLLVIALCVWVIWSLTRPSTIRT